MPPPPPPPVRPAPLSGPYDMLFLRPIPPMGVLAGGAHGDPVAGGKAVNAELRP